MAQVSGGVTGIILAGGKSSRFGGNKALAAWGGATVIERVLESIRPAVAQVLVVAKDTGLYGFLEVPGVRLARDCRRRIHPLSGLETGLKLSPLRYSFVCACDMPLIQAPLVAALAARSDGWDAVIPVWQGRPQTLCGLYSKGCLKSVRRLAGHGDASLQDLLGRIRTRFVDPDEVRRADPEGLSFADLDTWEEYRNSRRLHGA